MTPKNGKASQALQLTGQLPVGSAVLARDEPLVCRQIASRFTFPYLSQEPTLLKPEIGTFLTHYYSDCLHGASVMYPAQVPRDCYQVTSDEEFKQIEESLKAQLAKGSRPTLQPTFTDPEISGRTIMLEHGTDNQEWVVLKEATELLLGEDMPKSIFAVRARYALALAKNGAISQSIEAAKQAYVEHPEDYESYGAMAASRLACAQPLEAAKWLSLVTAAGGSHNAWFKKMVKEQAFSLHIGTRRNEGENRSSKSSKAILFCPPCSSIEPS